MVKKFNYLTISSISRAKGVYDFVKLAEEIKKKYPDDKFFWIGTGEIPNNLINNKNIIFLGFVSEKVKNKFLMGKNTIFILCSRFEGFSVPISEACLSEIPVLSYMLPEIVSIYGKNINYVSCFNINEFITKLTMIRNEYPKFKNNAFLFI